MVVSMKIQIEIPDPKFKVGDVVKVKNERNEKSMFLRVNSIEMVGEWVHREEGAWEQPITFAQLGPMAFYYTVALSGSYYDSDVIDLMDVGSHLPFAMNEMERNGELVEKEQCSMAL